MAKTLNVKPCPKCGREIHGSSGQCSSCYGRNTPEQRDKHELCAATARSTGKPCRRYAGQGTDHLGVGKCALHGGRTESHNKAAITALAKQRQVRLGVPVEKIAPGEALMGLLRATAGAINWAHSEILELDDLGSTEAQVLLKIYDDERDRLVRISEVAMRSGASAEEVRLQASRGKMLTDIVTAACREAELSPTQRAALGTALRKIVSEHRALGADGDAAEAHHREAAEEDAKLQELRERIQIEQDGRVSKAAERRARELSGLTFPPEELVPDDSAAA